MASSLKSSTVQSPQYGHGHNEFRSIAPTSKSSLLGIGGSDLPAADVNRRAAGW